MSPVDRVCGQCCAAKGMPLQQKTLSDNAAVLAAGTVGYRVSIRIISVKTS